MIEIQSYKEVNKNSLTGTFSIKIPKWGNFIIKDLCYFKKNTQRWISFPSRTYEVDGQKKYHPYALFEDAQMMKSFQEKVLQALDEYILKNSTSIDPVLNKNEVPNNQMEIPF
jgi:hypothetical protein